MPIDLDVNKQPATIEEAIDTVYNCLNDDEKAYIKKEGFPHFGAGMALRNGWNLWGAQEDNPKTLYNHVMERFGTEWSKCPGDDIAGMIYRGVEAKLKGEEFDLDGYVLRTKDFYSKQRR